jgi:nucleoside-diphosphate-sugar epimerase
VKVFLTGATGFIGSHVARLLVREGCEVTALARAGAVLRRVEDLRGAVRWLEGDLTDPDRLRAPLASDPPEVCLHLAWYAVPGQYLHATENLDCLRGSLGLLQALDEAGCPRVVMAGTCFEFDTRYGYLSETSPIRPQSLYAASKHALHLVAEQYQRLHGRRLAWARIFYQYGPWEDPRRFVPAVICALLAGEPCSLTQGGQVRDFLHIEDVARAIWAIARSDLEGPVVIGSSRPVTVADVARAIGDQIGRGELLRFGARPTPPDDPPFLCANTTLLRTRTDWSPRYDLRAGLAETIAWWKSQGNGVARPVDTA